MRKTDRKTENLLIRALTEACEIALERFDGFRWVTHYRRELPGREQWQVARALPRWSRRFPRR